jgi:predicted MFS family arabinose efflux permease
MSFGFSAIGLGTICVPQFLVWVSSNTSWRIALRWLSLAQFLACAFCVFVYRPLRERHSEVEGRVSEFSFSKLYDMSLFKNKSFLVLCIGSLFIGFVYYIAFVYIMIFAIEELGFSISTGALLMTVIGASDTISRIILSFYAEGTPSKRFNGFITSIIFLSFIYILLPLLCTWFVSSSLGILYGFCVLFGTFYSTLECLEPVVIADMMSVGHFSRAYGLYFAFQAIGYLSSSWIASELQSWIGVNSVLIFVGILFAFCAIWMLWARSLTSGEQKDTRVELITIEESTSNPTAS